MKLSIVSTLYRSAPYIEEFYRRMSAVAAKASAEYEIILVNDGSPDRSLDIAAAIHRKDPRVKVIDLSRNFGHHKAIMTGLAHAQGDMVFLIDVDLEEKPELLEGFLGELGRTGADVVYGVQRRRAGPLIETLPAVLFYRLINCLSDVEVPANSMTVRLMTRAYVQWLVQYRDQEVFLQGLWALTGFDQRPLLVDKGRKGTSTYNLARKRSNLINAVTSFTNKPLIYIFDLGIGIMALSLIYIGYLVLTRLLLKHSVPGYASIVVSIWFLGGLTICSLGTIGIYLSKIFMETKDRPYTVVKRIYGGPPPGSDA